VRELRRDIALDTTLLVDTDGRLTSSMWFNRKPMPQELEIQL
jgi:hypothetical protein